MRAADRAVLPVDVAEADRLLAPLTGFRRLALAVSGGPDSVALMRLVADWRYRSAEGPELRVLTVDHRLRAQSTGEAEQVCTWAEALGLRCSILTWQHGDLRGNLQAQAREARYCLMAEACHAGGLEGVVTAHHLDDQAETFLLRLARGSGIDGLSAMSAATRLFGTLILRPLLDVPRARLEATLGALGQQFIRDPSNDNQDFARARLRGLMRALAEEGMTAQRLAATARRMRRARHALEEATDTLAERVVALDRLGFCTLDDDLADVSDELALRLLARIVMAVGGSSLQPEEAALQRMLDTVRTGTRGGMTLAGCRLGHHAGRILFSRESGRKGLPELELENGRLAIWDNRFEVDAGAQGRALALRPLTSQGIATIRRAGVTLRVPSRIAATCPSLWRGNDLVFVPGILKDGVDFGEAGDVRIRFIGSLKMAPDGDERRFHALQTMI